MTTTRPLTSRRAPMGRRFRSLRLLPAFGFLFLVTLAAGHAEPGMGSRSLRPVQEGPTHADAPVDAETASKPYTFEAGRSWRRKAERMEHRGESRALLRYLDTLLARETGSGQAEVRLWRGAFIFRQGLQLKAGAVFDSLLEESPRYSILLSVPIAENAWRAALATDRPEAAARGLEAWWRAHRQLNALGLLPAAALSGELSTRIDSVHARACHDIGRLHLKWDRDREAGRRWLQRAVSVGLDDALDITARLDLAIMAGQDGAADAALAEIESLNERADLGSLPAPVRVRLRQARADAEYRAGRFAEARIHYTDLLPFARSAADSEWVMIQAAEAARHSEDGSGTREAYDHYLRAFPAGTWSGWGRAALADLDSTVADGEDS